MEGTSNQKRPLSAAERKRLQRQRQKEKDPDFQKKENERLRLLRNANRAKLDGLKLKELRKKEQIRQTIHREKKRKHDEKKTNSPIKVKIYTTPQSYGKALRKSLKSLPYSPRKQKAIVGGLAKAVGLRIENEMERKLKHHVTTEKHEKVTEFFFRKDIVYTAPGMKDFITVYENGKKKRLRKHYLTMFLREAHSIFIQTNPDVDISFSAFAKLKPKNVLLLKDTPMDQCKCEIHENFIYKLTALKISYHDMFWSKYLCNDVLSSDCWGGKCMGCCDGKRIELLMEPSEIVTYKKWELDENRNRRCFSNSCDAKELHQLVLKEFPVIQHHVQTKRIQEQKFHSDKERNDIAITQLDFAMAYSCDYQNEIQSALWTRASVNLLTLARYVNQNVSCHLFVLDDCYSKDKDAILACLYELFEKTAIQTEEIFYTDGPRSEFKNKYMMKVLHFFSEKFQVPFTWNYFATGHGKGVVDGIGGEAKSIVRQQVLSKTKNIVVQNASDFAEVCKINLPRVETHLMTKEHLEKIQCFDLWNVSPEVKGISKAHAAFMDTNGILKIWHNSLDREIPPIASFSYENTIPNGIPETMPLKKGDFVKVVSGMFKDYYAVVNESSYGGEIEINYFEKRDRYYVIRENDLDSRPVSDLQKVQGEMINSREHYKFISD